MDPWVWWVMRIVTGICLAAIYVVSESWLNDRASNENRGALLSVYMLIVTLGTGSGQFLLNIAEPTTADLFIVVSILVSVASVPILLTARPAPRFDTAESMSLIKLYKKSSLAVQSSLLTGAAHGTIYGMGAVYAVNIGMTTAQVATFMAAFSLGGLISQWPIGWLSDRIGRRDMLLYIGLGSALIAVLIAVFPTQGWMFMGAVALLGSMVMPMYSLCIAYLNDRLDPVDMIPASGAMLLASGIGLTAGPIIVAILMGRFGDHLFFYSIGVMFVLVVVAVMISRAQREVTAEEVEAQSPILPAVQSDRLWPP